MSRYVSTVFPKVVRSGKVYIECRSCQREFPRLIRVTRMVNPANNEDRVMAELPIKMDEAVKTGISKVCRVKGFVIPDNTRVEAR